MQIKVRLYPACENSFSNYLQDFISGEVNNELNHRIGSEKCTKVWRNKLQVAFFLRLVFVLGDDSRANWLERGTHLPTCFVAGNNAIKVW